MLKANPPAEVEEKIRQLAAAAGQPVTQFLNPFLLEIAEGRLKMIPQSFGHRPTQLPEQKAA